MKHIRTIAILNTIAYIIANVVSYLSNTGIFNGRTIGAVSAKYDALFVPAGFTFAIWGVIYAALYAFVVYHLIKAFRNDEYHEANQDLIKIGWLFILNNISTTFWVIAWVNEMLLVSVVLMVFQLITLIAVNIRLTIYDTSRSAASKGLTQFPLAIYFAWICIATIANISSVLAAMGWEGARITPDVWTVLLIGIALVLSYFIILKRRNVFFGLVVIWTVYGIISKQQNAQYRDIIIAGWVAIALLVIALIFQLIRNSKANYKA